MKAVQFAEHGGPEVIGYGDAPDPEVGHVAVQIADYLGAEVFATASTDAKLDHARNCGATPKQFDDVLELVWDGTFESRVRDILPMSETARTRTPREPRGVRQSRGRSGQ